MPRSPYNRMQMQLGFESQIPDGLLAANALLAENSRQGFEAYSGTVHQGFGVVISHTSLGIKESLYDGGTGSRCTQKERDTETGNDYFLARYYSSALGRFTTPDWSAKEDPVPYAVFTDPQSLNLFGYVRNNPVIHVDADGHVAGVDDLAVLGAVAFIGAAAIYESWAQTPAGQRTLTNLGNAAEANFKSNVATAKNAVSGLFSKRSDQTPAKPADPGKPGTKGKPDHQATAAEEAEKIGGKPEVRIPTPGGEKQTRVGDAVAKDANGNVTAVTQVIRPTPKGNVPKREKSAADDIEKATGVKPKLVPVRPLPK